MPARNRCARCRAGTPPDRPARRAFRLRSRANASAACPGVGGPTYGVGMQDTEGLVASPGPEPDRVRLGTPVDGVHVLASLSPSRAADFRTCPLLFRFRTVDRLPEAPSPEALRGTVVHKVLEDLFDLPALERTPGRAEDMVQAAWELVLDAEPETALMFSGDGPDIVEWLASCRESLRSYFDLEDPRRLEPAEREVYVEALLDSRLLLRGFVDRIDVAMREGLTCVLSVKVPDPKFSLADQGQAGLLRGAAGGAGGGRRRALPLVRDASEGSAARPRPGRARRRGAEGGAAGAREGGAQERARHLDPARQARRLPGEGRRRSASCSWSRATAPAAPPSRAATASSRRSCRSRARS